MWPPMGSGESSSSSPGMKACSLAPFLGGEQKRKEKTS